MIYEKKKEFTPEEKMPGKNNTIRKECFRG